MSTTSLSPEELAQKAKLELNQGLIQAGADARASSVVAFLRARSKYLLKKAREYFAVDNFTLHAWYEAKSTESYIMADAIEDGADLRPWQEP